MKDEEKDTGRIEAFSDGVFSIAITLLLRSGVPEQVIRKFTRNYRLGFPLYLLATAAAFVSPFYTIGICTALWVFWAFTMRREESGGHSS